MPRSGMATISPKGVTRFWRGIASAPRLAGARPSLVGKIRHFQVDELPRIAMRLLGFGVQPDLAAILGNLRLHRRELHIVDVGRDRIALEGDAQNVLVAGMGFDAVRLAVV